MLIMAGQGLELIVLALTLIGLYQGLQYADPDFRTYEWYSPLSYLGILILLFGEVASLAGLLCSQGFHDPEVPQRINPSAALFFVCIVRLLYGLLLVIGGGPLSSYLTDESVWEDWYYWAALWRCWATEGLLVLVLYRFGREIRDEQMLFRVWLVVAALVAEVVSQMVVAVGILDRCPKGIASQLGIGQMWAGILLAVPMLLLRMAIVILLLGACSGALQGRRAGWEGGD
jgi:hypothetical protein